MSGTFTLVRGDAFYLPGAEDHLCFVLYDPAVRPDLIVVVTMTTFRLKDKPRHRRPGRPRFAPDESCVLNPGDHEDVAHESYILYQQPHRMSLSYLLGCHTSGTFRRRRNCSRE